MVLVYPQKQQYAYAGYPAPAAYPGPYYHGSQYGPYNYWRNSVSSLSTGERKSLERGAWNVLVVNLNVTWQAMIPKGNDKKKKKNETNETKNEDSERSIVNPKPSLREEKNKKQRRTTLGPALGIIYHLF